MNGRSIGSWLDTKALPVEEDRLLKDSDKFIPFAVFGTRPSCGEGCLGGVAFLYNYGEDSRFNGTGEGKWFPNSDTHTRFNRLVQRFAGVPQSCRIAGMYWGYVSEDAKENFRKAGKLVGELVRRRIQANRTRRQPV